MPDNKVVINSRIYAPEKNKTFELPKETNVYKLWDKEITDTSNVTYKSLDKRFYFMRADNYIFPSSVTIGSETLIDETTIGQAPFESFFKLPLMDIVQDYYTPIFQILNKAVLVDAEIYLTEKDIVDIDFSKLYWIEELNSYFILNKISNFQGKGSTKCELIKVDYVNTETRVLSPVFISFFEGCITYTSNTDFASVNLQHSIDNGLTWTDNLIGGITSGYLSVSCGYTITTDTLFRIVNTLNEEIISNTILVQP